MEKGKFGRNTRAVIWLAVVGGVIGILIYFEQIAIIYALSTVAMIILLLVVAFADLENVELKTRDTTQSFEPGTDKFNDTLER